MESKNLKIFLDYLKKTLSSFKKFSFLKSKNILTASYYQYDNIKLKLYVEITDSGNIESLCYKGLPNKEKCAEIWEDIVKKSAEINGNFEFDNYFEAYQNYSIALSDYLFIRACLLKFWFKGLYKKDLPLIEKLKARGFVIDLTEREKYKVSLIKATKKVRSLITKILNKKSEFEEFNKKGEKKEKEKTSFDSIMAALTFQWPGTGITDDITLARYNECVKILKLRERNKKQQEWLTN